MGGFLQFQITDGSLFITTRHSTASRRKALVMARVLVLNRLFYCC
ncbi:MAG TPA: hypothetical protein VKM55_02455 [Candidatus Lokiarchaeia archaeon]|nr:hypothetical protein [Candidatus Lokiarchaeia archaeon]